MSNIKQGIENVVGKAIDSASEENKVDLRKKFEDALTILLELEGTTKGDVKKIEVDTASQIEALKWKVTGATDLTVKNATLALIEEYVSKAFDGARRKLEHDFVRSRSYDRFLRNAIDEGVEKIAKDNLTITTNSKDVEKVRSIARNVEKKRSIKIKVLRQSINCIGGVRVGDSNETMLYDNTIEMRLSRAGASLRKVIAGIYLRGEEKIGS